MRTKWCLVRTLLLTGLAVAAIGPSAAAAEDEKCTPGILPCPKETGPTKQPRVGSAIGRSEPEYLKAVRALNEREAYTTMESNEEEFKMGIDGELGGSPRRASE